MLEDGIELRSGKSLKTMNEIIHEHDEGLQQSNIIHSTNRTAYTTSKLDSMSRSRKDTLNENKNAQTSSRNKKALKSKENEKQYSHSERKHYTESNADSYAESGSFLDYNNIKSRRSLNTDFATNTNLSRSRVSNRGVNNRLTMNSYPKLGYDGEDDGPSRAGYSVRTVTKTLTEEFEETDGGITEKGAMEVSEKNSQSSRNKPGQNNIHLYGECCII